MTLVQLLESKRQTILDEAIASLTRAHLKHYEAGGLDQSRDRLARLYDLAVECVKSRSLAGMVGYARQLAGERHREGFDLGEVQTAFNVLEEVLWRHVETDLAPPDYPEAFGLVSTVLGAGKGALAVEYVSLATRTGVGSLDLSALFKGA